MAEDGSVIIKVALETDSVDRGVVKIEAGCRRAATAAAGLQSALNGTRGALLSAFTPVSTAVAPALSQMCSMLATAAGYVSSFFAALGGAGAYRSGASSALSAGVSRVGTAAAAAIGNVRALGSAVKTAAVSTDGFGAKAAAALGGVRTGAVGAAGGVKAIGKEAKKAERNLSGLDELNIWQVKDEAGSGGGGGSGGGLAGGGGWPNWAELPIAGLFAARMRTVASHLSGLMDTVRSAVGGTASTALKRQMDRVRRDATAAFKKIREAAAGHMTGLQADVEDAYGGMAATVAAKSAAMETASASAWRGMKTLLLDAAGGMQAKVAEAYDAMGGKVSAAMAQTRQDSGASWWAIAADTTAATATVGSLASQAWEKVPQAVTEHMGQAVRASASSWTAMESSVKTAGAQLRTAAASAFSEVASAVTSKMNSLKASAASWGKDLCANLASGIQKNVRRVSEAAASAAGAISAYLHFSVPDKGPLSDADEYGPDFVRLLSQGIRAKRGEAVKAAAELAGAVSEQMSGGGTLSAAVAVTDGGELTALTERLEALSAALESLAAPLRRLGALPTPVLASGTVLPPRAVYTDGGVPGLGDVGSRLRQLLTGGGEARDGRPVQYTFIGQIDRKVLFREVIDEGRARQGQNGKNPFFLEG